MDIFQKCWNGDPTVVIRVLQVKYIKYFSDFHIYVLKIEKKNDIQPLMYCFCFRLLYLLHDHI